MVAISDFFAPGRVKRWRYVSSARTTAVNAGGVLRNVSSGGGLGGFVVVLFRPIRLDFRERVDGPRGVEVPPEGEGDMECILALFLIVGFVGDLLSPCVCCWDWDFSLRAATDALRTKPGVGRGDWVEENARRGESVFGVCGTEEDDGEEEDDCWIERRPSASCRCRSRVWLLGRVGRWGMRSCCGREDVGSGGGCCCWAREEEEEARRRGDLCGFDMLTEVVRRSFVEWIGAA